MNGWSTQQLTEFLAAIGAASSRVTAMRLAVERVAEAVEAEVAMIVTDGRLTAQIGFAPRRVPRALLSGIAGGKDPIEIPGLGICRTASSRFGGDGASLLIVARAGETSFTSEEQALLRAMARVLTLSLRSLKLLESERAARRASEREAADIAERQRLLEALSGVQRMIVDRAPLQEVLDAITAGMAAVTGDDVVGLRLLDADPPASVRVASIHGVESATMNQIASDSPESGVGWLALSEDRVVVIEDYPNHPAAISGLVAIGVQAAAAAPVRQLGRPIGSLSTASVRPGRRYNDTERSALVAFAEHASLAITDAARTGEMVHSALHDALTGLPNRALFSDRLAQGLVASRRARLPAAVLFIDLDRLKLVNDSLGHLAGDEVLVEISRRLSAAVRPEDTVARISGDEFTVLIDSVESDREVMNTAHRLLDEIRRPLAVGGRTVGLSASIGVRLARPGVDRADDVMRGADMAMYEAKAVGGGAVKLFHPELDRRANRRLELESELRAGLEKGAFRLLYQPIVDLGDNRIRGVEALLRWDRGAAGLVSPVEFIPLAEETGFIVELGAWVFGEACRAVAKLGAASGRPDLQLSVNLSARQLVDRGLEATVASALASSGMRADRLTLEITESVLMSDKLATINQLTSLRRLGVRVSVDDFGTGYSSLSYLRQFPLDEVKIDRSFVEEVAAGTRQSALVRGIVALCHTLGLETVGEGVETKDQARSLAELDCDRAQGYLFGRPMSAEDLGRRLRSPEPRRRVARVPAPAAAGVYAAAR